MAGAIWQVPNKIQHVLCTGNLVTKEQFDELRNLAPNVHVVAGDCDQVRVCTAAEERGSNRRWFVSPGSITGAFSSVTSDVVPSFMLMALQGAKVVAFVYELKGDNVVVSKSEFTKET
ncbi:hypothetical protein BBJ28_00017795 [Nothophytophthora sp. Chile5]|nr:hypothetical protein BBJ28_00017795 [Nothophytophthora sp. Chile5]